MTLEQFYNKVFERQRSRKERLGQAMFNILAEVRSDLSEQIRGTDLDPYYAPVGADRSYTKINNLKQWLAENW